MHVAGAIAMRNDGNIVVMVYGETPEPGESAEIVDVYPGGNIQYFIDPGFARVFIKYLPGVVDGTNNKNEWLSMVTIPDSEHTEVEIFLNDQNRLTTTIFDTFQPLAINTKEKEHV